MGPWSPKFRSACSCCMLMLFARVFACDSMHACIHSLHVARHASVFICAFCRIHADLVKGARRSRAAAKSAARAQRRAEGEAVYRCQMCVRACCMHAHAPRSRPRVVPFVFWLVYALHANRITMHTYIALPCIHACLAGPCEHAYAAAYIQHAGGFGACTCKSACRWAGRAGLLAAKPPGNCVWNAGGEMIRALKPCPERAFSRLISKNSRSAKAAQAAEAPLRPRGP